jgi:DNA repair photolyase
MSNSVIYEPKGPAAEYSHLAVNLYHGCEFGCIYCYAPKIARKPLADWSANPEPKKDILERLQRDAEKMAGDKRTILLCYTSDPYQSPEAAELTRQALLILEKYELTATVLTKGGLCATQDFDILQRNDWQLGVTASVFDDNIRRKWEPNAASIDSRESALRSAKRSAIKRWVSVEPVYDTDEALKLIDYWGGLGLVDFWKIGKLNHYKNDIDWAKFLADVTALCDKLNLDYYIKKELAAFG